MLRQRKRRGARFVPARARERVGLADGWRAWLADNLARGVTLDRLEAALEGRGVARALVRREARSLVERGSVGLVSAALRRARNLELVLRAQRTMWRERTEPDGVVRRAGLSAEAFFEQHYCANKPVIVTDVVREWPACTRWTLDFFEERFGAVAVEAMVGRDADPDCDRRFESHRTAMTMAELIAALRARDGNDVYMVARNRTMEREGMAPLFDDIAPPEEWLDPARLRGACSLWLGPAGTVTPLHHDKNNILFCQIRGTKRVRLVAPFEIEIFDSLGSIYSPIDPLAEGDARHPALDRIHIHEVTLESGEALFIPIGWFHHVTALTQSVSMSFTGFRRANDFAWYTPGHLR